MGALAWCDGAAMRVEVSDVSEHAVEQRAASPRSVGAKGAELSGGDGQMVGVPVGQSVAQLAAPLTGRAASLDASPAVAQLRARQASLATAPQVAQLRRRADVQQGGAPIQLARGRHGQNRQGLRSNKHQRRFQDQQQRGRARHEQRGSRPRGGRARRREAERERQRGAQREGGHHGGGGGGASSSLLPMLLLMLVLGGLVTPTLGAATGPRGGGRGGLGGQGGRGGDGPLALPGGDLGMSLALTNTTMPMTSLQTGLAPFDAPVDAGPIVEPNELPELDFGNLAMRGTMIDRGPQFDGGQRFGPDLSGLGQGREPASDGLLVNFLRDPNFDDTLIGGAWNRMTALENFDEGSWPHRLLGNLPHKIIKNFSRQEFAAIAKHYPWSWPVQVPRAMNSIYRPVESAVGRKWEGQQKGNAIRHINWIINADRFSGGNLDFVRELADAHEHGRQGSMFDEVSDRINNQIAMRESSRRAGTSASDIGEDLWSQGLLARNANFVVGAPSLEELQAIGGSWRQALAFLGNIEGGDPDFNEENREYLDWALRFAKPDASD